MKTTLVYFDTLEQSKKGLLRGTIAFFSLIILDALWFYFNKNLYSSVVTKKFNLLPALAVWIILCSALAVQLPNSLKEAAVYGILVGFVVYGIYNLTNMTIMNWPLRITIIDTLWGMTACGITSILLYIILH
tara:strand:+ start:303 stop:698 length:396 start_codon:yes stop_codon:yes gene_type:complete